MLKLMSELLRLFDCDEGVSGDCFEFAVAMFTTVLGSKAAKVFSQYVDATDGHFYLKRGTFDDCWLQMIDA